MRVLSLFSGYGGLDLGLQAVYPDARTVYVADVEEGPRRVLAHRFPDAIQLGDVTTVDWAALTPVDVIIGGSPCQDLSLAGRRAGMKQGTRSGLWESMAEAIRIMQPRLVVWENVKGALSAPAYSRMESDVGRVGGPANGPVLRALGRVVGDLTCLGYDCRWTTLSAASVGAPHLRERVFLVAHSTSYTGGQQYREPELFVVDPGSDRFGRDCNELDQQEHATITGDKPLLSTPQARDWKGIPGNGFNVKSLPRDISLFPTPNASVSNDGEGPSLWGKYLPAITDWENVTGVPAPSPVMYSRTGKQQLSHLFVEWMMGLEPGWVTDPQIWGDVHPFKARNLILRLLGNGVVPRQAALAIQTLLQSVADAT